MVIITDEQIARDRSTMVITATLIIVVFIGALVFVYQLGMDNRKIEYKEVPSEPIIVTQEKVQYVYQNITPEPKEVVAKVFKDDTEVREEYERWNMVR